MDLPDEKGWDAIESEQAASIEAIDDASRIETTRCLNLVEREIEEGHARGIPVTAGVMVILHRIKAAIQNG